MKAGHLFVLFCSVLILGMVTRPHGTLARPSYFTANCAGCHSNDSATCNGCHHHGAVNLTAVTDKAQYKCGEPVMVTLNGGTESGWIRALLFDQSGVEIARATGPTHMGDDGLPNPVVFPVTFVANAPVGIGIYTWQAAWWGSPFDVGNRTAYPHGPEVRVSVTVNVVGPSAVESSTWGRIKAVFR